MRDRPSAIVHRPSSRGGLIWRLLLTVALLGVLATQVDFAQMGAIFASLHWWLLLAALGLAFLDRVLATLRWWLLLRVRGAAIGFTPLLVLHLAASFLGGFLPTSFSVDAVRIVMLARRTGRTVDCIAASLVDRIMMMFGTLTLAMIMALVVAGALLPAALRWTIMVTFAVVLLALVAFLVAGGSAPVMRLGSRVRGMLGERIGSRAARLYWAIHEYRGAPAALTAGVGITVLMLAARLLFMLVLAWTLQAQPAVAMLLIVSPLIWVILMLPISIGGFGVQEAAFAALLGAAGIGTTLAVSMSLLEHVVTRLVSLPGAVGWSIGGLGGQRATEGAPVADRSARVRAARRRAEGHVSVSGVVSR